MDVGELLAAVILAKKNRLRAFAQVRVKAKGLLRKVIDNSS